MEKISFFFEQDGAPAHRSIKTCNWISTQKVQLIQDWPPNSPDLSCIEQVWSILERRIKKYNINNLNELYNALQKEWYSLDDDLLNRLIASTPGRFKLCLKENGHPIGHKLYQLKKSNSDNFYEENEINNSDNYIINQNSTENSTENSENTQISHILKIPLFKPKDMNLCKLIAKSLINYGKLPYFLRDKYADIKNFEQIIKHPISIPDIIEKIDANQYQTVNEFFDDIHLIYENLKIIYGEKLTDIPSLMELFNELDFIWNNSI